MAARASLFQDHTAVAGAVRSLEWRESTAGSSPNRKRHSSDHAPAKRQVIRADELNLQHVAPGFDAADGPLSDAIVAGHRLNRNDLAVEIQVEVPRRRAHRSDLDPEHGGNDERQHQGRDGQEDKASSSGLPPLARAWSLPEVGLDMCW